MASSMSTCDCEVGTFTPTLDFPLTVPNNNPGNITENNALRLTTLFAPIFEAYYKVINDCVEVTILVQGVDYVVNSFDTTTTPATVRRTGFVSFSLPLSAPPLPGTIPLGIANWLGPVFNPSNPGQISTGNFMGGPASRRVCIPGTVYSAGGMLAADATIGSFDINDLFFNPFAPNEYIGGVLVIKCSYNR
jgi:hypothetical protein